jgi:hypothetical protein
MATTRLPRRVRALARRRRHLRAPSPAEMLLRLRRHLEHAQG